MRISDWSSDVCSSDLSGKPISETTMLQLTDVVAGYGSLKVLHGITLHVPRGKIVTLLGSNGAGKSTTVNTIAGLTKRISGSIEFDGAYIDSLPAHHV